MAYYSHTKQKSRKNQSPNSTIVLSGSSDNDDVIIMESNERIPFLDLDPPTPKKAKVEESPKKAKVEESPNKSKEEESPKKAKVEESPKKTKLEESPKPKLQSVIQKPSDGTEDGEIVSSPEIDYASGVEITIHAEVSSDDDSLTGKSPRDDSKKSKDSTPKKEEKETVSAPKSKKEEAPRKDLPVQKQIGAVVEVEEDVEMDHLEIVVPQQQELKKIRSKSKLKETSSPGKNKDGRTSGRVSPADQVRKRTHDTTSEETRRHSDNESERSKRTQDSGDLRKHLMMKMGKERDLGKSKESRDHADRYREGKDSKEWKDKDRDRRDKDKYSSDRKRKEDSQVGRTTVSSKDKNTTEPSEKKKDRSRRREDKDRSNKKKKKRKHKESLEVADKKGDSTPLRDEPMQVDTSLPTESKIVTKDREPSYDDISSPESKKSPRLTTANETRSPPASPLSDSEPPTPPSSVENTPSRSPTPERSPTPVRKRTYFPGIEGCRNVEEFSWLNRIEEGTYGVVYRARDRRSDEIVALKRLKMEKEREGFPITSLREINTLLKSQHPNIVTVREIVVGSNMDKIYIVMDYVEHDLKALMETMTNPFLVGEVKTLMMQLMSGVRHMHDNWILHRDIKASNLLLSHKGILKIGDFGLAREYGSPLKKYTSIVVTLWYRAPELLLGQKLYSTAIDIWSCGCVFAELLTMKPLFPGKSEIDQINKIFKELGTPNDRIWPGPPAYSELPQVKKMNIVTHPFNNLRSRFGANLTDKGFDLMNMLLTYDPAKRITSDDALKHDYFKESPKPVDPSMFPTWPAKSELGHKVKKNASPKAPQGGGQPLEQMGDIEGGFHLGGTTKGISAKGQGFNLRF